MNKLLSVFESDWGIGVGMLMLGSVTFAVLFAMDGWNAKSVAILPTQNVAHRNLKWAVRGAVLDLGVQSIGYEPYIKASYVGCQVPETIGMLGLDYQWHGREGN